MNDERVAFPTTAAALGSSQPGKPLDDVDRDFAGDAGGEDGRSDEIRFRQEKGGDENRRNRS